MAKRHPFFVFLGMPRYMMNQAPATGGVEDFSFWLPISKATARIDPKSGTQYREIFGVASTPDLDLQNEVVHQTGLELDYFLKHGYFNNDHKPGFSNKVGEPTQAVVKNNEFQVRGFLYNNHPVADGIWDLMEAQEKTPQARRKVGFSVQGKVKRRMGNQIQRCWVQDVAITTAPINTNTWAQIAKSLAADQWSEDAEEDDEEALDRALTAGYATSGQTGGAALRTESLGPRVHDQQWGGRERVRKSMDREEAVRYLQLHRGFSRSTAALVVEAHCAWAI